MNLLKTTKVFIFKHKIISTILILCLLGGGYWWYKASTNASGVTRYVLATVTKGTIISFVSGTGQVAASNQLDIKAEASGKIVYMNIQAGQEVKAGTLLAEINPANAQKTVQSAENDLANAKLSTTDVSGSATDALNASYDNGLNALTNTFKDLATIKANLDPLFTTSSYNGSNSDINYYLSFIKFYDNNPTSLNYWNNDAEKKYDDMQAGLAAIEQTGWLINKSSSDSQIEGAINDTYTSSTAFLDLVRQAFNLTQEYQNTLSSKSLTTPIKTATTATQITNLSAAVSSLSTDTNALLSAKNDIIAKKQTFSEIGTNIQSQNLNIQQYQNALADAKDALAKCYTYASIDGVISAADSTIKVGDTVSSGTVLGTIVTKQEMTTISLSETDIPKIKMGDKAIITFDAIDGLSITGKVTEIDTVGTVSQGVVSYNVKIIFDTQDDRIKPGMSTSVNIVTDTQQNVLTVPNSAVKSRPKGYPYVLIPGTSAPTQKAVQIGISDNTNTEITGGLSEGDHVIVRTISGTATSSATRATTNTATRSLFSAGGGPGR